MKEMLKKFGFDDCKPVTTPLTIGFNFSKDDESPKVEQKKYESMIGGLLYLIASRPAIMQTVCLIARCSILKLDSLQFLSHLGPSP